MIKVVWVIHMVSRRGEIHMDENNVNGFDNMDD